MWLPAQPSLTGTLDTGPPSPAEGPEPEPRTSAVGDADTPEAAGSVPPGKAHSLSRSAVLPGARGSPCRLTAAKKRQGPLRGPWPGGERCSGLRHREGGGNALAVNNAACLLDLNS